LAPDIPAEAASDADADEVVGDEVKEEVPYKTINS